MLGPKLSSAWAIVPFSPGWTASSWNPNAVFSQSIAAGASR